MGNKWTQIALLMPGRTEIQVKNRFNAIYRKKEAKCQLEWEKLSFPDNFDFQTGSTAECSETELRDTEVEKDKSSEEMFENDFGMNCLSCFSFSDCFLSPEQNLQCAQGCDPIYLNQLENENQYSSCESNQLQGSVPDPADVISYDERFPSKIDIDNSVDQYNRSFMIRSYLWSQASNSSAFGKLAELIDS